MVSLRTAIIALSFVVMGTDALAQVSIISQEQNDSDFLLELTKAIDPASVSVLGLFNRIPLGENNKDIAPECDPKVFEDNLLSKRRSTEEYFKTIKQYFAQCQAELAKNSPKGILSLAKMALDEYQFYQNPEVTKMVIPLPDGTMVPAILALKQDPRPRPLVIMKCGVFCGSDQNPMMKNYLIQLFDLAPFNVILLSNQTGTDYLVTNAHLSLGGWSEGFEALQIGKWLREKWDLRDRISSLHLMGMSLGGNAATFGAYFNDMYPMANGQKVFTSATAICPVITLKPTLDHLYGDNVIGPVFNMMTHNQFRLVRKHLTDVPDMLAEDQLPPRTKMPDYIGDLASTSLQRRGIASTTPTEFFKNNNFWNLPNKIHTPIMVWASKDDAVVSNKLNAQVFEHDDYYETAPNAGVVNLNYGSHCAFSSAYGYQAASVVLRSFVMSHSPEFVDAYKRVETPWKYGFQKMSNLYQHVGQSWKFDAKSPTATVTFRLFNSAANKVCSLKEPFDDDTLGCVTTKSFNVPIADLKAMGARVPMTDAEAQAMTRAFNTKVEFMADGKPLNGTSSSSIVMSWRPLFD